MAKQQFNGRFAQKIDSEVNWNKATNFIPMAGEIIIYKADENYSYDRIKIGDGETTVINLPFINIIDTNLTQPGQAADAKAVGDEINKKVDKVDGKGLSTNDYIDIDKANVDTLRTYTATYDGTGTVFGLNSHLYTVTIEDKFIGENVSEEELRDFSLKVKFEDSASDTALALALRINNSNYYVLGGANYEGALFRGNGKWPFKGNVTNLQFHITDSYETTSQWRCIWTTPGSYSGFTKGGTNFSQAVAVSKGGTGATTVEEARENLDVWSSTEIQNYINETFLGGTW